MKYTFVSLLILLSVTSTFCQSKDLKTEIFEIENSLQPPIVVKDDPTPPRSVTMRMEDLKIPGVSVAVVKDGRIHFTKCYGKANTETGAEVDEATLFQAGSISKPLAALAALHLAEGGKVDLDTDVNQYLVGWKLPDSEHAEGEKATLRRLITHTAGTTVHGFPGYSDKDEFPTIEQVLNGEGNTPKVEVNQKPGTNWRYSGGGYTVMEKVIEDVSGMPLEDYMDKYIFPALNMTNSTYAQPLPQSRRQNVSLAYNRKGKIIDGSFHHYPEQAAAGLWTTPTDLANYVIEMQKIIGGKTGGIISPQMAQQMITPDHGWGLGLSLRGEGQDLLFGHGGKNAGFTNNMIADAHGGDGIIIMTNADNGNTLITELQSSISMYYDMDISSTKEIEVIKMTPSELKRFEGTYIYSSDTDHKAKIKVKKDELVVKLGSTHSITPIGPLTFMDLKDPETISFIEDEDGEITGFRLERPGIVFEKVDE